jgi:TorA maturation chaperone TorD
MNARNIALTLVIASLGYGIWYYHSDAGRLRQEMDQLKSAQELALQAKDEEMQRSLAAQNAQHQATLQSLNEEYDKKLVGMRQEQRQQMASAYKEFENIFSGNKQTIEYINLLEGKVKAGQALSKNEVERLTVITSGISFLQKQYQKPMQEFAALQEYFEAASKRPNEKPKSNFGFFKRMFSKDFREAEKEHLREEGARRAFTEAQGKFETVYASAQRSMRSVNLDADAQIKKLNELTEDKKIANAEDLSSFFDKARQALRTHQDVLDFEPAEIPQAPRVQP